MTITKPLDVKTFLIWRHSKSFLLVFLLRARLYFIDIAFATLYLRIWQLAKWKCALYSCE